MSKDTIGPLLACAVSDAYGAGFEYVPSKEVRASNDLSGYQPHPKWSKEPGGIQPGQYTDDTQMALGLAEHMLDDGRWNIIALASRWLGAFTRDHRTGYSGGFYDLLCEAEKGGWVGAQLAARLNPTSNKNGGAMRAFPVGFLTDTQEVIDLAMLQASLTHATETGMVAAAAAALMFHHRYHCLGPKAELPFFLDRWLPGWKFEEAWTGKVGSNGVDTVRAALTAFMQGTDLAHVLRLSVAFTGDVDTVAAIAMPAAAVCEETLKTFPQVLLDGLEDDEYGSSYLIDIDEKLAAKYPRASDREAALEAARQAKRDAKAVAASPPAAPEPDEPEESGPLDFLFDDD